MTDFWKKSVRVGMWVVVAVLVLLGLLMALSPVAKYVINNYGRDIVGREMAAGSVFINPYVGSVTVRDFHLREENGLSDFVTFNELYVRANIPALLFRTVDIRRIRLTEPTIQVLNGGNRFNFSDIIERFASKDTTARDTTPSTWRVELNRIALERGQIAYVDVVRDKRWDLHNVNLDIPGLYFGDRQSNAGLTFDLPTGGSINITAGYIMSRNRYSVTLRLRDVNTDIALPFVQDLADIRSLGALLSGSLHADGGLEHPDDLRLNGRLRLDALDIRDHDRNSILAWDSLLVGIKKIDLNVYTFDFDTIRMDGLRAAYEQDKEGNTLSRLLKPDTASIAAADSVEVPENAQKNIRKRFSIRQLAVNGGTISYTDKSMRKTFHYEVSDITMSAANVRSEGDNSVSLSARLGGNGRLKATYSGDVELTKGRDVLSLQLSGVDVRDFSPYTESLMAYPLKRGSLSLRSVNSIQNGIMDGQNRLEIQNMEVGNKQRLHKAPYSKIPLKLGVNLLKSSKGLIVMELPVQGDIRSPKFSYRQIIRRAVGKIFLGPLMGVSEKSELQGILEEIGDSQLTEELSPMMESEAVDSVRSGGSLSGEADIAGAADSAVVLPKPAD